MKPKIHFSMGGKKDENDESLLNKSQTQQVKSKVRLPEGSSETSARKIPIILLLDYLPARQQMVKNLYQSGAPHQITLL